MKYIKNLERNQYWKQNRFGYTSDLNEAGKFDSEEVIQICRDANIMGRVEDIALTEEDIIYGEENETIPTSPYKKRNIESVVEEIGKDSYHDHNPIAHVIGTLIENEYYPTADYDNLRNFGENIRYGEKFEENIKIAGESELFVKMSIERMSSGRYELVVYGNKSKPQKKRRNNVRP